MDIGKFWGRIVTPRTEPKSRKAKQARRATMERVHVITGKPGDIITIGGTKYRIAPAGNIVKVE